ncbi:MAG: sel1 repeat family protein [Candidatus Competibacteraceae bacterium]|nr:sel1 repeat family protein [Candidatus Competibacteraceae bacterium]
MIPGPIYEVLPYAYMLVGAFAIISIDIIVAKVCGLILMILGGFIYQARRRYRHRKVRLEDMKGAKARAKKTFGSDRQDTLKSQQDFQKGEDCFEQGDYSEAVKWYLKAAEQGNSSAQVNLGAMHAEGWGTPRDFQEALFWYRAAAQQGDAVAFFNLGVMYVEGQGVPHDLQEALKCYRKAADQGNALAQFNLGMMYEQNDDALSLQEAVSWYRKASEQDYAPAQVNLAVMYVEGRGVPQDMLEALKWYQKAAAQDYAPAQFNLGVMYFQGQEGIPKDLGMAYVWFYRSADQGDEDARIMRDKVASRLTSEQRTHAQELLQVPVE